MRFAIDPSHSLTLHPLKGHISPLCSTYVTVQHSEIDKQDAGFTPVTGGKFPVFTHTLGGEITELPWSASTQRVFSVSF